MESIKVIPRNYGSIGHLPGSKQTDREDQWVGLDMAKRVTENLYHGLNPSKHKKNSLTLEVQEKVDGSNMRIIKQSNNLKPINKKGYGLEQMKLGFQLLLSDYIKA